jgi:hypothetical protein
MGNFAKVVGASVKGGLPLLRERYGLPLGVLLVAMPVEEPE